MVLLESLDILMGEPAVDFSLPGTDDKTYALGDFAGAKVLVVVFMCNHCPYVQAVWGRLVKLQEKYMDGVKFVGINPNYNPDYPEDSMEKMKEYYEKYGMNFPYLLDETQEVARAYKAQCTPDIFVYDEDRKLTYHGRIDDNWQEEDEVTKRELDEALDVLMKGLRLEEKQFPSMGCSIKWRD